MTTADTSQFEITHFVCPSGLVVGFLEPNETDDVLSTENRLKVAFKKGCQEQTGKLYSVLGSLVRAKLVVSI